MPSSTSNSSNSSSGGSANSSVTVDTRTDGSKCEHVQDNTQRKTSGRPEGYDSGGCCAHDQGMWGVWESLVGGMVSE